MVTLIVVALAFQWACLIVTLPYAITAGTMRAWLKYAGPIGVASVIALGGLALVAK